MVAFMTRNIWRLAFVAFNLTLIVLTMTRSQPASPLSVTCQGNLSYSDRHDDSEFIFEGLVAMHFEPNGTGYFSMNGDIRHLPQHWQVSRQTFFTWAQRRDRLYDIVITGIQHFSHDTVPEGILEKNIAGLTLGQKRAFTITKTPDGALVLGPATSPIFICAD